CARIVDYACFAYW
nr:immunoglobulin heavy chain junction region [Mus musculus]